MGKGSCMKYKLLVLDIDGTLTNEKKEITRHTKQTILRMQKAGVKVVLASGRPAYGVVPTARELELEQYGGFILSYNGGRIVDCSTGRTIYEKTIPHKLMGGIYGQVHDLDAALMTYEGDRIITEKPQDAYVAKESFINKMKVKGVGNFLDYVTFPVVKCLVAADGGFILSYNGGRIVDCSTGRTIYEKTIPHKLMGGIYGQVHDLDAALMTYEGDRIITEKPQDAYVAKESFINKMKVKGVGNFLDYVTFPVVKCLVAADGGYLEAVEDKLKGYFGSQLSIFRSEPYFLEIMPKDIDKASSLERLRLQLGLERAEIAACGDGLNDISMIQYAGLGIAMANAQEAVKRVCDFVTKSNEEEGVAYAIDRFILG